MNNGYYCVKNKNFTTCICCPNYKRGNCPGALRTNLFRQNSKGNYELYHPLQQLINYIAKTFMINTKEVLEILLKKYDLKIDRTVLFKYYKDGLIERKQKIGKGRGKGVKTYWSDKTPLKIFAIKRIMKEGITINEIKKYHSILYEFKNPEILKGYRPKLINLDDKSLKLKEKEHYLALSDLEVAKFHVATYYFAVCEAGARYAFKKPIDPSTRIGYIVAIGYDKNDPNRSSVVAYIYNKDQNEWGKKVLFKKEGVEVINLS